MCVGTLVGVKIHEHGCRVQKLILNTFPLSLSSSLIPRLAIQLVELARLPGDPLSLLLEYWDSWGRGGHDTCLNFL